jgi:hypothetical protein
MGQRKAPKPVRTMMPQQVTHETHSAASIEGRMEPELQDHIGRQLRAVYKEVLEEPVPDRFLKLLAELEGKRGAKS